MIVHRYKERGPPGSIVLQYGQYLQSVQQDSCLLGRWREHAHIRAVEAVMMCEWEMRCEDECV